MYKELIPGKILTDQGNLIDYGISLKGDQIYSRELIKNSKFSIKEKDFYYITNENCAILFSILNYSYFSEVEVIFFDIAGNSHDDFKLKRLIPNKMFELSPDPLKSAISIEDKNLNLKISDDKNRRHIVCNVQRFGNRRHFRCDLYLEKYVNNFIASVVPFSKPNQFAYFCRLNLLKVYGYLKFGNEMIDMNKQTFCTYSFIRGVFPFSYSYYWSSLSFEQKGHKIGFNLGYGLPKDKSLSENIFYCDGKSYKLNDVKFDIPISAKGDDDFMTRWKFRSENGDISIVFTPLLYRKLTSSLLMLNETNHLVIGTFSGTITINKTKIEIDSLPGFALKNISRL